MTKNTEIELEFKGLTSKIIACGIEVHKNLGPGFLESIYHNALLLELKKQGLKTESQKEVEICYNEEIVGIHRLDIVVENAVIIELKAVTAYDPCHKAQLLSYLKATGIKMGLLLNFAQTILLVKRLVY